MNWMTSAKTRMGGKKRKQSELRLTAVSVTLCLAS
jgi:hypothetical protein